MPLHLNLKRILKLKKNTWYSSILYTSKGCLGRQCGFTQSTQNLPLEDLNFFCFCFLRRSLFWTSTLILISSSTLDESFNLSLRPSFLFYKKFYDGIISILLKVSKEIYFFKRFIYLRETEQEGGWRGTSRLRAKQGDQWRTQLRSQSHDPAIIALANIKSWTLNPLMRFKEIWRCFIKFLPLYKYWYLK